jgi:hypothetical protein
VKHDKQKLKKIITEMFGSQNDVGEWGTSLESGAVSKVNKAIQALHDITGLFPQHDKDIEMFAAMLRDLLNRDKPNTDGQPARGLVRSQDRF